MFVQAWGQNAKESENINKFLSIYALKIVKKVSEWMDVQV